MSSSGFFVSKKIQANTPHAAQHGGCTACGLDRTCKSPRMPVTGEGRKRIFVLAEAPGTEEDARNTQLIGKAGQQLRQELVHIGIDLDRDCWKMNAVNCRPPQNRKPTDKEIEYCRTHVLAELTRLQPNLVLLLGGVAVKSFLAHRWRKELGGITRWRGWRIPDREVGAWVCPTFHPSYIQRMQSSNQPVAATIWKKDLAAAAELVGMPIPHAGSGIVEKENVEVVTQPHNVRAALHNLPVREGSLLSFDYETTGRKPYQPEHRVVAASLYTGEGSCVSFPVQHRDHDLREIVVPYLHRYLQNPNVRKVAHGLSFEDVWTKICFGFPVRGWEWCTKTAAHILENRKDITWLKFLVYVYLGIVDYDSSVSRYLRSAEQKNANSFNNADDAPLSELLLYCGLDAIFTHVIATMQRKQIEAEGLLPAANFFHEGLKSLAAVEQAGVVMDVEYCRQHIVHNRTRVLPHFERKIRESELGRVWREVYGAKMNLDSSAQLRGVLFEHMNLTPPTWTEKGTPQVNQAALEQLDVPGVTLLVRRSKLFKALRYLDGMLREAPDGWLHPFFHLHLATSYRSSSSHINFQNMPARDEDAKRLVRSAIQPRPGRQLLCIDYSGIEVRVACCVTEDPKLIEDTLRGDMHHDMALELYLLDELDKNIPGEKVLRQGAKNGFVFPEFYGDYYLNCVDGLLKWAGAAKLRDGTPALVHLHDRKLIVLDRSGKVRDTSEFERHVAAVENNFWHTRYRAYTEWKKQHMREYERRGYFDMVTGFRCRGVMRRNEALNLPIQGPAFHCLLWALQRLLRECVKKGWKSDIIGQIHDELVIDAVPDETDEIYTTAERIMTQEIRDEWKWIIVPLAVEAEKTPVDGTWYEKGE